MPNSEVCWIEEWLKYVFEDEHIPDFEQSEDLMNALRQLMLKHKESERDAKEIMKAEQKYTEIYKNKTDELNSILNAESLSLSSETLEAVEQIAVASKKLNLKEPTITNFLLAVNEAENKEMEAKEKEMLEDYHLATLSKKVTKIMKTNHLIRRDLAMLENTVEHQDAYKPKVLTNNSFLDTKIEEYKRRIKKFERDLSKRNYDSSLEHNQLIKKSEAIDKLEKEVQSLHLKLNSYQSLPPNKSLTLLKIQTTRNELAALEDEFQKLLESASGASIS
ncbi:hypothetical protein JTE90_028870 [Oedothorax gibbosus]|uniref:HAUS augmin-like complex subunit 1 n=1 Tax=Oedothorax gibbosus TaxID=931172 RepID=A0AAV6U7L1_9ARAC|nr:hypothetical protein JTE90_028870 [Oedothorax gibbosus]